MYDGFLSCFGVMLWRFSLSNLYRRGESLVLVPCVPVQLSELSPSWVFRGVVVQPSRQWWSLSMEETAVGRRSIRLP